MRAANERAGTTTSLSSYWTSRGRLREPVAGAEMLRRGDSAGTAPRPVPLTGSALWRRVSVVGSGDHPRSEEGARSNARGTNAQDPVAPKRYWSQTTSTERRKSARTESAREAAQGSEHHRTIPRLITGSTLRVPDRRRRGSLPDAWGLVRWYLDTSYFLTRSRKPDSRRPG